MTGTQVWVSNYIIFTIIIAKDQEDNEEIIQSKDEEIMRLKEENQQLKSDKSSIQVSTMIITIKLRHVEYQLSLTCRKFFSLT